MNERITDLSGIELGVGPRGEYYLFVTSETLQKSTMIDLEGSTPQTTKRKVLDAWVKEQLKKQRPK
jgi:hypothetical protein